MEATLTLVIRILPFIIGILAFIAVFMMFSVSKKFGTGILATGFKGIASALIFIASGILLRGIVALFIPEPSIALSIVRIIAYLLVIIGIYLILKATKETADKMQTLTK